MPLESAFGSGAYCDSCEVFCANALWIDDLFILSEKFTNTLDNIFLMEQW